MSATGQADGHQNQPPPPPPPTVTPPSVKLFNMTPEIIANIIMSATDVPMQQVVQQQKQMQGFCEDLQAQRAKVQTLFLDQIRSLQPESSDSLKKLREKEPQFAPLSGRSEDFLGWAIDCQTKYEQRLLYDEVAIAYANFAMG